VRTLLATMLTEVPVVVMPPEDTMQMRLTNGADGVPTVAPPTDTMRTPPVLTLVAWSRVEESADKKW
jgi:hypothetical protein